MLFFHLRQITIKLHMTIVPLCMNTVADPDPMEQLQRMFSHQHRNQLKPIRVWTHSGDYHSWYAFICEIYDTLTDSFTLIETENDTDMITMD